MAEKKTTAYTDASSIKENVPGLLPFIPVLYIAWSDCVLTPTEISTIRQQIDGQSWLTEEEQHTLAAWLDPAAPPNQDLLLTWLKIVRQTAGKFSDTAKKSLLNLGLEISRIGAPQSSKRCTSPEACSALAVIEQLLDVVSQEATRKVLAEAVHVKPTVTAGRKKPGFSPVLLQQVLDGEEADMRDKVRTLLSDPVFHYRYELDKQAYREQVLLWCKQLAAQGLGALSYPQAQGGKNNLRQFIAAFETIALHDLSLAIKFGVQFGLFGGSILNLGTAVHHEKYLQDVGSLQLPGCFAMTELGHGSNVKDIETTATYDRETDEFIIHTPNDSAHKDYIGNAALHGQMATVFAQLEIDGECYGVHAFLTPIRHKDGTLMPGVRIEDCGLKMGINGVDNGRISIATASLSAAKSALTIAIRYAEQRRQFGPPGEHETLLLDYPSHQRRLLPLLARTYAFDFAQKQLIALYAATKESAREVEVLAAGLKALSSWHATETIQVCRESCGGKGYLAENRFAALKADTDVFATFEGDNTVLLQLLAKGLLTEFKHQFNEMNTLGVLKYAARQAAQKISALNPVITRLTDETHLHDPEFHLSAFSYREQRLLISAARRIKNRIDNGSDSYQAFLDCQNHLITLAKAHVQHIMLKEFQTGLKAIRDEKVHTILSKIYTLFALSTLEQNRGWFLENGYFEGGKAKASATRLISFVRNYGRKPWRWWILSASPMHVWLLP